mmetsp:Transcript_6636/g.10141  ORF Transcript_6636/g.10141 Transcript_6636/m.10141 type:complete len:192 (-) Transcript_6636:31-606(-)
MQERTATSSRSLRVFWQGNRMQASAVSRYAFGMRCPILTRLPPLSGREKETKEQERRKQEAEDIVLTNTTLSSDNSEVEVIDLENEPPFSMLMHMKEDKAQREKKGLAPPMKQSRLHHVPPPDLDPEPLVTSSKPVNLLEERQNQRRDIAMLNKFRQHGKERPAEEDGWEISDGRGGGARPEESSCKGGKR